jgi:hypothetical protein
MLHYSLYFFPSFWIYNYLCLAYHFTVWFWKYKQTQSYSHPTCTPVALYTILHCVQTLVVSIGELKACLEKHISHYIHTFVYIQHSFSFISCLFLVLLSFFLNNTWIFLKKECKHWSLKQEDYEFKASVDYMARPCLKKKQNCEP